MAGYTLIDGYLDTMRSEIRWRSDLEDVVAEMRDHLYSAVEFSLQRGADPTSAQRTTLDRFGEPKVLAAVYASTSNGGISVPTTSTVRAGLFALVAAALLAVAAPVALFGFQSQTESLVAYLAFAALVTAAGVLGIVALTGVNKRLGGLGAVGMTGIVVFALGVAMSGFVTWAVPFWMFIQGVGLVIFAVAVGRRGSAPMLPTVMLAAGPWVGIAIFAAIDFADVGPTDSYGDQIYAWAFGGAAGLAILAFGYFGIGRWLRPEEPVDLELGNMATPA